MRRLLIVLVVLVGLLIAADRIGVVVADRALATEVQSQLALDERPDVSIRGIPFLTQAIRGKYSDVRVELPSVDSGPLQNIRVNARLQGARIPLGDAIRRQVSEVPVDRITGDLTVGYDDLARASGIQNLTIVRDGDGLKVSGSVEVLGQQVDANATGSVAVQDNDLVITAERAEVGGVELPEAALRAAAQLLSFKVSPRGLPLALRITDVTIGDTGLQVSAVSEDAVLKPDTVPVN
jgi:hypothetical protein